MKFTNFNDRLIASFRQAIKDINIEKDILLNYYQFFNQFEFFCDLSKHFQPQIPIERFEDDVFFFYDTRGDELLVKKGLSFEHILKFNIKGDKFKASKSKAYIIDDDEKSLFYVNEHLNLYNASLTGWYSDCKHLIREGDYILIEHLGIMEKDNYLTMEKEMEENKDFEKEAKEYLYDEFIKKRQQGFFIVLKLEGGQMTVRDIETNQEKTIPISFDVKRIS